VVKLEALSSNPSTSKKEKKNVITNLLILYYILSLGQMKYFKINLPVFVVVFGGTGGKHFTT
jgi:hypothetical protein